MLVYVDHNLGTVVKNAFVVPEPLADGSRMYRTLPSDNWPICRPVVELRHAGYGTAGKEDQGHRQHVANHEIPQVSEEEAEIVAEFTRQLLVEDLAEAP